jgi:N-acetylglutamate synthase-like GNAT family acetyltransferase
VRKRTSITLVGFFNQPRESLLTKIIEITYIFVKSSSRRNGIGSQLVRECRKRAEGAGFPLVVSSEPAAYEFFLKNGFNESKHFDFDLSKWALPYSGFGIFRLTRLAWDA